MRFTPEMARAARLVAEAEGLPRNWLNGAVAVFTPAGDLQPQVLHQSDCLTVEAPCPTVLLAMKLHAARGQDLEDAARLAREAGISDSDEMLALVADAYGADAATADTGDFAERALSLALPQDRGAPVLRRGRYRSGTVECPVEEVATWLSGTSTVGDRFVGLRRG